MVLGSCKNNLSEIEHSLLGRQENPDATLLLNTLTVFSVSNGNEIYLLSHKYAGYHNRSTKWFHNIVFTYCTQSCARMVRFLARRNYSTQWSHPSQGFGQNLQAWTPAYEHVRVRSGSHISLWIKPRKRHGSSSSLLNTTLFLGIVTLFPVRLTALLLKLKEPVLLIWGCQYSTRIK